MGVFSKTFHKNFSERSGAEAERSGAGAERSGEKVFVKRFLSNTPIFCSTKVCSFSFERSDVLPFFCTFEVTNAVKEYGFFSVLSAMSHV